MIMEGEANASPDRVGRKRPTPIEFEKMGRWIIRV